MANFTIDDTLRNFTIDDPLRNEMLIDAILKLYSSSYNDYDSRRHPYARSGKIMPIKTIRAEISSFLNDNYGQTIGRSRLVRGRGSRRKLYWEIIEEAAKQLSYERRYVIPSNLPNNPAGLQIMPIDMGKSHGSQIYWVKVNPQPQ